MKKFLSIIIFSSIILYQTGCLCSSKKDNPQITCRIECSKEQTLPLTKEKFAIAFLDVTIFEVAKYPTTSSSEVYEHITVIPNNTKAIIDGKEYPISVKKRYKKIMGKKVHKLPSWFVGNPDNAIKGEFCTLIKDSTKLINNYFDLLKNNKIYYNSFFENALNIMYHPEIKKNMRTRNVRQIFITEYYIPNGQTVTFEGKIENDTLFLMY